MGKRSQERMTETQLDVRQAAAIRRKEAVTAYERQRDAKIAAAMVKMLAQRTMRRKVCPDGTPCDLHSVQAGDCTSHTCHNDVFRNRICGL
jgi:hypothetical protein